MIYRTPFMIILKLKISIWKPYTFFLLIYFSWIISIDVQAFGGNYVFLILFYLLKRDTFDVFVTL